MKGCPILAQRRLDCHQMGRIWTFYDSISVHFGSVNEIWSKDLRTLTFWAQIVRSQTTKVRWLLGHIEDTEWDKSEWFNFKISSLSQNNTKLIYLE